MAAHEGQVVVGVVLEFILALSVIGIAALLLPVLRPHGEGLAVGYVAVRTLEAAFILMATTTALLVLALGQDGAVPLRPGCNRWAARCSRRGSGPTSSGPCPCSA